MRRIFKAKRTRKYKLLIFLIITILSVFISNKVINGLSKEYIISGKLEKFNIDIDKEKFLLKMGLNYKKINKIKENDLNVFNELVYDNPKVYIYNTHNREEYDGGSVVDAAKYLKEELTKYNIDALVETKDIVGEVKSNNLQYKDTYKVTRELISKNIDDDISLYIDLHRDSVNKSVTTTEIDGKSYAKMLFVVGGKHETYMENYNVCDNLNKFVKNINSSLSRGILVRKSSSYNQDLKSNVILIEMGSEKNTMEEVNNTISFLAEAISNYIKE